MEYKRDTLVDCMGTLGDSVGSQGDSSLVLANIELATDEHSYGSSSLHMHKSHTSQKQSGSVTTTVGYEKVEMHEDSNVGDEYSYGSYYLHMSKTKPKSHTSQRQSGSATMEYEKDTMADWVVTLVDGVEMQEDSSSEWPRLSRPQMSNTTAPLPNKCPSPTPARGSPSTPM